MPEPIAAEAFHAAAEAVRDARCGHAAGRWACFSCRAEAAVEAAAPLLAAQVRRETLRDVASLGERGLVVVSTEDLDIILNQGDQKAGWQRYSEACNRLRAALPERTTDA